MHGLGPSVNQGSPIMLLKGLTDGPILRLQDKVDGAINRLEGTHQKC